MQPERRKRKARLPVWRAEPDAELVISDPATGYAIALWRNNVGAWCGYVGVPASHWAFGLDYGSDELAAVTVHGGLTYSGDGDRLMASLRKHGMDVPDGYAQRWWLGFDCAHCDDFFPLEWQHRARAGEINNLAARRAYLKHCEDLSVLGLDFGGTYRTIEYARAEALDLAKQLHKGRRDGLPHSP